MGKFSLPVTRHGIEKKETHRRTSKNILRKHSDKEKVEREGEKREEKNKSFWFVRLFSQMHPIKSIKGTNHMFPLDMLVCNIN